MAEITSQLIEPTFCLAHNAGKASIDHYARTGDLQREEICGSDKKQ